MNSRKEEKEAGLHINLSEQSVTIFPRHLIKNKAVQSIDLSRNCLRKIPPEIRRLTYLTSLDLSQTCIKCNDPEDFSSLPIELSTLHNLGALNVSQCNLRYVPPVIWKCLSLTSLDISVNKLNVLPPDVGYLERLRRLNAHHCNIATVPKEIGYCQHLEEILLWGNVIESLPDTIRFIPVLTTMQVNYKSFCSVVDEYMEGLLRNGEIPSEHLPQIVFEMPSLASVDFTDTKINCLPERCEAQFREVILANNFFHSFPGILFNLDKLRTLDLSGNQIKTIPDEISTLKSLRILLLERNCIESVPAAIGAMSALEELNLGRNFIRDLPEAVGGLKNLKLLLLERNRITGLPESLGDLRNLETLDLTANNLHSLPRDLYKMAALTTMHSYRKLRKCGLWLHLNPLESIPQHIWKTDNPASLYNYLRNQHCENLQYPQRVKMAVVGSAGCGKTSVMRALKNGTAPTVGAATNPTELVEFNLWRTVNDLNVFVYDISGNAREEHVRSAISLFFPSNCMYLLAYDCSTYSVDRYKDCIGDWVDIILTHCRSVVLSVVATKRDLCPATDEERLRQESVRVLQMIDAQLKDYKKRLRRTTKMIDRILESLVDKKDNEIIMRKLEAERARLESMLTTDSIRLQTNVVCVGSTADIASLNTDIEQTFLDEKLFPSDSGSISRKKLRAIDKLAKAQPGWILGRSEVLEIASKCDVAECDVSSVLQSLCDAGNLLWFPTIDSLREVAFHRVSRLAEVFRSVFCTDMKTYLDHEKTRTSLMFGFDAESWLAARSNITQNGEVSRALLSAMWFPQVIKYEDIVQRCEILLKFDLCYSVPESSEKTDETSTFLVFPALNRLTYNCNAAGLDVFKLKRRENVLPSLESIYTFPVLPAIGLFERLSVRIHDMLVERMDWNDFVIGLLEDGSFLSLKKTNGSITVTVEGARKETDGLQILERVSQDVESLMLLFPGIAYCCELKRNLQ